MDNLHDSNKPVAWIRPSGRAMLEAVGYCTVYASDGMSNHSIALCESPPAQRKLTDEQIDAAVKAWFENDIVAGRQPFAKRMRAAIEAAHGIKENT